MKLNSKSFTCGMLAIFLMLGSVFVSTVSNNETIQTSARVELSNSKIEWGIKRADNHEQPDLGSKNRDLIEKYGNGK